MASQSILFFGIPLLLLSLILPAQGCYKAIFNFGDSLSDTGNSFYGSVANFPYGMTYFHKPTGRYCDGRIILDFIAKAFGLPLVPPYLPSAIVGDDEAFRHGANFAVGGMTALDKSYFTSKGIVVPIEYPLSVQIGEFQQLLHRLSNHSDSYDVLGKSLVLLGEIGGNDYMYLIDILVISELKEMAPTVINAIGSAIETVIELGAKVIVAPGVTPFGCVDYLLSKFQNSRAEEYDRNGCLKWLNELARYHNELLQNELEQIRNHNPDITIIYADYYHAAMKLYQHPEEFGFEVPLCPCIGSGVVCSDPSVYICWDGMHFTEAAYKKMAKGILEGNYTDPPLRNTCSLISSY